MVDRVFAGQRASPRDAVGGREIKLIVRQMQPKDEK
jgi:hypothetical protein